MEKTILSLCRRLQLRRDELIMASSHETWVHVFLALAIAPAISIDFFCDLGDIVVSHQIAANTQTGAMVKQDEHERTNGQKIAHSNWNGSVSSAGFPSFRHGQILLSEDDLHFHVSRFIREKCPDLLQMPTLGELGAVSEDIRKLAWSRGYTRGSPDLLVIGPAPFNGKLALEFKSPKGGCETSDALARRSNDQVEIHGKLERSGWQVLTSSNSSKS